ncbi:hypothetical protein ACIP5Y_06330 [Nocardia sp. NPDC088792]|uniref:hypothetical protein n=1 Tax=Nocardia sp. NPDC088792 TaxID=3364332 RepID=UPI0037F7BED3
MKMNDQEWDRPRVDSIKGLGTSWYRRGGSYWTKRTFATILYAIILCVGVLLVGTIIININHSVNTLGRVVLWTVVVSVVLVSHYYGFRDMNPQRKTVPSSTGRTGAAGAGMGTGVAALGGSGLAGGLLAIGLFVGVGWFTAMFVYSLTRYTSSTEVQAVQAMREWYLQRPEIPDSQRPRQFRHATLDAIGR